MRCVILSRRLTENFMVTRVASLICHGINRLIGIFILLSDRKKATCYNSYSATILGSVFLKMKKKKDVIGFQVYTKAET